MFGCPHQDNSFFAAKAFRVVALAIDATVRRINMIAAWSVDRLGHSLQHLVRFRRR